MTTGQIKQRESEKFKLTEILQNELPPNIDVSWDNTTRALILKNHKTQKIVLEIDYKYPPYPHSNDSLEIIANTKSRLKMS